MGAYSSHFQQSELVKTNLVTEGEAVWVTAHSTLTGLSIVEVERLWLRFKQLGSNRRGSLTVSGVKCDWMSRQILGQLQDLKGEISFQTFLLALKWWETCSLEQRWDGLFHVFNTGYGCPQGKWQDLVSHVCTHLDKSEQGDVANAFMSEMDTNSDKTVDKNEFSKWCSSQQQTVMTDMFQFDIVPAGIAAQAEQMFSGTAPGAPAQFIKPIPDGPGAPSGKGPGGRQWDDPVEEHLLQRLSERLETRDWRLLANNLNFLSQDVEGIAFVYPETYDQVLSMLRTWRDREPTKNGLMSLEQALIASNMADLVPILRPSV